MRALAPVALLMMLLGAPAQGAVILYNNFGPGNSYNTSTGWTIGTGSAFSQGDRFSPTATGSLSTIEVAMGLVSGTNQVFFELRADAGGTPGAVIESFVATNQMGSFGSNNPPILLTSALNPMLTSGQNYWLIAVPDPSNPWSAWNWNSTGITSLHASRTGNNPFSISTTTQGAFRVSALDAVPEPISLLVFGGLVVGGGLVARKRLMKKAVA